MSECSINIKNPHLSAVRCGCVESVTLNAKKLIQVCHVLKAYVWSCCAYGWAFLIEYATMRCWQGCHTGHGVFVPRLQCYSLLNLFLCVGLWIHWSCQEDTVEGKQGNLYVREACRTVWMLPCASPAGTCSRGLMCVHGFRCSARWEPAYTGPCLRQSNSDGSTHVWLWGVLWMDLDASIEFRFRDVIQILKQNKKTEKWKAQPAFEQGDAEFKAVCGSSTVSSHLLQSLDTDGLVFVSP